MGEISDRWAAGLAEFLSRGDSNCLHSGLSFERKLVAPVWAAPMILAVVEINCMPDPDHPTGLVRSIYFDTLRLKSLSEKLNGDALKRKARFRWYGEDRVGIDGCVSVYLEFKDRICAARHKRRIRFTADPDLLESAPLHDRRLVDIMREQTSRLGISVAPELVPVLSIRYKRRRFVCRRTGVRVAVDTGIEADRANPHLCGGALPARTDVAVLEFKGGRDDISWMRELRVIGAVPAGFSKYEACMKALEGGR